MKLTVSKFSNPVEVIELVSSDGGDGATYFIGRAKDCRVVLDDQQVSRYHVELKFEKGQWVLVKKASMGQMSINGSLLDHHKLSEDDILAIGPFQIGFTELGEETSQPIEAVSGPQESEAETSAEESAESTEESETTEKEEDTPLELSEDQPGGDEEDTGDLGFSEVEGDSENSDFNNEEDGEESSEAEDSFEEDGAGFSDEESGFDGDEESDGGGFEVEAYDDDEDNDLGESTQVFQSFVNFELSLAGDKAPYDKYLIEQPEIKIGRDPEQCQIVLNDSEVSGVHAILKKNNVTCTLEDLQSSNGTILNGSRINKAELSNGDEFSIGTTIFQFKVKSSMLEEESERLMPVEENQVMEVEEVVEVGVDFSGQDGAMVEHSDEDDLEEPAFGEAPEAAPASQSLIDKFKALPPKKRMIYGVAGACLLMLLLGGEEEVPAKKSAKKKSDKSKLLLAKEEKEKKDKAKGATPGLPTADQVSEETKQDLERKYQLAKNLFTEGRYRESMFELDEILKVVQDYKESKTMYQQAKDGLAQLEEIERRRRKEVEAAKRREKVKGLVEKAGQAVKDRQVQLAKGFFSKILELDPENFEVPQLKLEIDAYVKEKERKELEAAQKKAERQRKVDALKPGKNYYLQEKWYLSILTLERFLNKKDMDEDLIKEAKNMLETSKSKLKSQIAPILGKARSLKEGQDLKGAYEAYTEVVRIDPSNTEALDNVSSISDNIEARAKKIYREAIIAESLSLFNEAKEKFQEVQQTSPSDSLYYKKATKKLSEYLE